MTETKTDSAGFEQIDINSFFENEDKNTVVETEKADAFTKKQLDLINQLMPTLLSDKEHAEIYLNRINDLESMAVSIDKFPSLLERHELTGGTRTPKTLIESLVKHQNDQGDRIFQLPSKAVLGKSLLVAKTHTLSSFSKYCAHLGSNFEKLSSEFKNETILSMFSLLVEDVYLNLISDISQPIDFRREWALSLLLLWEHWNDQTIETVAPVLQAVWNARRRLAPAFGTMMGTSELLMISMQMDEQWISFIKNKMGEQGVTQAMEEFLFGISHEQINLLRETLRSKGIAAIGRDEVKNFIGDHIKADAGLDYRDFYSMYAIRRDNARSRARMHVEGPVKTLEDYFIQFITEQNHKKQENDTFAK